MKLNVITPNSRVGETDTFRQKRLLDIVNLLHNSNRDAWCELHWPTREEAARTELNRDFSHTFNDRTLITMHQQLRHHSAIIRAGAEMFTADQVAEFSAPSIDRSKKAKWNSSGVDVSPLMNGSEAIPVRLSADIKFSRQLAMTSPLMASGFIESQVISAIGAALDDAAINGTGTGQPLGLLAHPSVPEVGASSAYTFGNVLDMEKSVADNHGEADPYGMTWFADPATRKALRTTARSAGIASSIWSDGPGGGPLGYRGIASPWAPANTLVFGFAADILIVQFKEIILSTSPTRAEAIAGFQTMVASGSFTVTILNPANSFVRGVVS